MRIATMVIGLLLGLVMTVQVIALNALVGTASEMGSVEAQAMEGSIALGVLVVIFWLLGIAFAYGLPKISIVVFALAGLFAFIISGDYPDMAVWGVLSIILAVMSYFGVREKRTKDAKNKQIEDALLRVGQS